MPPLWLSKKKSNLDMAEMSKDIHHRHPRRPWPSPDPDPKVITSYPRRESHRSHSSHHLDPSPTSSSSRSKNERYFYPRHHLNSASAQYGHPFPTEGQPSPRESPPLSNKPSTHGTHSTHGAHGYMNPPQDRIAGSMPHHDTLSEVDTRMPPGDKIPDQESDDNHTVDHPPDQWYPPSGPPDWRYRYDPRDHNLRSPHPYRRDPPYPYTLPYHHYRPPGLGIARSYGPNGWPYRYDYDPRSYIRYGPQPWSQPGPGWDYAPGSRPIERGRYRAPVPEYRGDSFGRPGWVQVYPYRARDTPYDPHGLPLEFPDTSRPQDQNHYTVANDSYSHPSSQYEDMELRRYQTEYSYRGEEYGSGTPPSPLLAGASASKSKATTPTSVTTVSAIQKQLKAVDDIQNVQTKQEPMLLRPRQDGHNLQGPSPVLAKDQTPGADRVRPDRRGSPGSLPHGTLPRTSSPRGNLPIQAVPPALHKRGWPATGSLPPRLKIDSRTDYPTPLPPPEGSGYRTLPSPDIYPESSLSDPKLATPSMLRHDRKGMWAKRLDDRSPRTLTHPEGRGRTDSLPGYLMDDTQVLRDGIQRLPPPCPPTGSPSGMGSLKSTAVSVPSPSGSSPVLPIITHSSSSSLSPPPVKLGQEGYYRQKDLEQLFRIWKSEYELSSSDHLKLSDRHHHHQYRCVGSQDEGEKIEGSQDEGENIEGSQGSSGSNNDTTTTTGPSWKEKAKWKWNAMMQEFGPDGKKRKTMNDHQGVGQAEDAEELANEHGTSQPVRGEGHEDGQVDELEDDLMEDDYESDLQGELKTWRTESAGETSESGSRLETQDGIRHEKSRTIRQHGTSHHLTTPSGPSAQPDGSSAPVDSNLLVEAAPAKKRRIRVRESKNHWCEQCGKRFSRPSQLLTHSFTHSGEKPHQCHMCYKHFNVASNLKRHIRTHASSRRKSSRIGNTVFRGFALGYPTARTSNAESTSNTTTESVSASASANTIPSQEANSMDDNNGQLGSGVQGHSTRAIARRTERTVIKHPLAPMNSEASKSSGTSSGSGSSTARVPVMPPPSAPPHHAGGTHVPGRQKDESAHHRDHVDEGDNVEVPDTEG